MEKSLTEALAAFNRDFVLEQVKNRLDGGENPINLVLELQKRDEDCRRTDSVTEIIFSASL